MWKLLFSVLLLALPNALFAQMHISGRVLDAKTGKALPYARVSNLQDRNDQLTAIDGKFEIDLPENTKTISISYIGYFSRSVQIDDAEKPLYIFLQPKTENLQKVIVTSTPRLADSLISKVIAKKAQNDPDRKLNSYHFRSYNKLIIDDENHDLSIRADTTRSKVKIILKKGRAYLSEQVADFSFTKESGLKEKIVGTRTAGFKKPVYELLTLKVQSNSWYKKKYTVFGNDYAGPLYKNPFRNYDYRVLDTTMGKRPAYIIHFKPKRQKAVAGLEGVLYIDTLNFGLQKAIGALKGKVDLKAMQDFKYYPEQDLWFPKQQQITLRPGNGEKPVSIYGGNIAFGSLKAKQKDNQEPPLYLRSETIYSNIVFNDKKTVSDQKQVIEVLPGATEKPDGFWQENRKLPYTDKDEITFIKVDSLIKKENIARRIEVIEKFNNGYYPIGFFDFDLRTLIKVNNYEGLRLGGGGVTNDRFSKKFRLQTYADYGFKDKKWKYSYGGGINLGHKSSTWLDLSYTKDIAEVGSFIYLTDLLVYSLFEPRLVNINFYYKYKKIKASFTHDFGPKLKSQLQFSHSDIEQTGDYQFENNGKLYSDYTITKAVAAFRWSPFSEYLVSPTKTIQTQVNYPKFTFQATQALDGLFDGDFNYTKLGAKIEYNIKRLNQSETDILLDGDYVFGDFPLTHAFHAYPNNPTKPTLLKRFSVAGRRGFETMYFSEFFSDKLLTLQINHHLHPFDFGKHFKPELVFITRHAIGGFGHPEKNKNITFETLDKGYSESGFEINKLFLGFGLSFAYRYGAYHLPKFEDNVAFKFTFYLKL